MDEIALQRKYYEDTASKYDSIHLNENDNHFFSLELLSAYIRFHGVKSVFEIGCGTGRSLVYLRERFPELRLAGVEPSSSLRELAWNKGVPRDVLRDGDATALAEGDDEYDLVCEFGALHHIKDVNRAVREMCRVARLGVFISDANNFGQGGPFARFVKQALRATGLWPVANFIKTRGKGYTFTEGDGVAYSYSVFDSLPIVREKFPAVFYTNTEPCDGDMYRGAGHLSVFARK